MHGSTRTRHLAAFPALCHLGSAAASAVSGRLVHASCTVFLFAQEFCRESHDLEAVIALFVLLVFAQQLQREVALLIEEQFDAQARICSECGSCRWHARMP